MQILNSAQINHPAQENSDGRKGTLIQPRKHRPVDTQKLKQKLGLGKSGMSIEDQFIGILE